MQLHIFFTKRLIAKFAINKSDYCIYRICITNPLKIFYSTASTWIPRKLKMSITFSSNFSSATLATIPWISKLLLLVYWSKLLFFWSSSNSWFSSFLTLFWNFKFSSLRTSMIVFLTLNMLSVPSSVNEFLMLFFSFIQSSIDIGKFNVYTVFKLFKRKTKLRFENR